MAPREKIAAIESLLEVVGLFIEQEEDYKEARYQAKAAPPPETAQDSPVHIAHWLRWLTGGEAVKRVHASLVVALDAPALDGSLCVQAGTSVLELQKSLTSLQGMHRAFRKGVEEQRGALEGIISIGGAGSHLSEGQRAALERVSREGPVATLAGMGPLLPYGPGGAAARFARGSGPPPLDPRKLKREGPKPRSLTVPPSKRFTQLAARGDAMDAAMQGKFDSIEKAIEREAVRRANKLKREGTDGKF